MLANEALYFCGVAELVAAHALADAVENLGGGADADIGGDEREFELIEQAGVDFLLALDGVFERGNQAGAGFLDTALELLEKGRLLLHGAEQGLNHFEDYFSRGDGKGWELSVIEVEVRA